MGKHKENMRVAVCFSGQMRNLKRTYDNFIKPNFYDCNNEWQIDTFAHTWFDMNDIGKSYSKASGGNASNPIPREVLTSLYECYNPKKSLIEKQIEFDEKNYNSRKAGKIIVKFSLSKMYSIKQVSLLKKKAEKEGGFTYDAVFHARYDIGIKKPLKIDNFDLNCYNTSPRGTAGHGVDVTHAIMSSQIFDTYASFYDHIDEYFKKGIVFVDEKLCGNFLLDKEINIQRHGLMDHYDLVRE